MVAYGTRADVLSIFIVRVKVEPFLVLVILSKG